MLTHDQIAGLDAAGAPILSVYLDLDPAAQVGRTYRVAFDGMTRPWSCAGCCRARSRTGWRRVSTALAGARIDRRQACYRPVTDDGLPLIGRVPGLADAYVATGHGPWGMLNAPATGLALAELIADGAAKSIDLSAFDPARRR